MKRYFNTVKSLLNIANEKYFTVIQMFISCGLYNLSYLLPPIATAGIIKVISDNNFNGIWIYVILYLLFYFIYFIMLSWNYKTYTKLADYYHIIVQKKLIDHIANNDLIFNKISKGKIVNTTSNDIRYLVDVLDASSEALMGLIQLIVIFAIFSYYNIVVAVLAIFIDAIYLIFMNNNSKKVSKYYEATSKYEDKIIDTLNQMLLNIKQIKSLNIMPNLNKNIDKTRNKWSEVYSKKRKATTERYCKMPAIVYVGKVLLYIFLGLLVTNGKMTIDKLILLISYFEMAIDCTDSMLDYLLDLSNYGVRVKRIENILNFSSDSDIDYGDINNDYINGLVEFDKVNYVKSDNKILNNVSFKLYPNEITTIVGHSGSGKTSIVNLLYRLDRIRSGSITIDNENIYNYNKKVYSSNVSGVFQKNIIFQMSIKDNLSLVDKNQKNQIEACKRVNLHDYIESLPKGYNTIISEDDNIFTEGQRQKLAIARALLSKSEILVFDEITSNIDPSSTQEISDIILDLKIDHTILMVTHKPEIMNIADRIIVLDKGKVVCQGLNDEVYEKCELYKELKNKVFASISKEDDN